MMTYKGYIGNIEYDDVQHVFCGTVANTRTVITFQGTSADELENAFHESVDDYLEWCREDGISPEKPYSGKLNLRLQPELHRMAASAARILGISLNSFIEKAVRDELMTITG